MHDLLRMTVLLAWKLESLLVSPLTIAMRIERRKSFISWFNSLTIKFSPEETINPHQARSCKCRVNLVPFMHTGRKGVEREKEKKGEQSKVECCASQWAADQIWGKFGSFMVGTSERKGRMKEVISHPPSCSQYICPNVSVFCFYKFYFYPTFIGFINNSSSLEVFSLILP